MGNRQYPGHFAGPKSARELNKPPIGPASVIVNSDRRTTRERPPPPPAPARADREEADEDPPVSRPEAALRAATAPLAAAAARALPSRWAARTARARAAGSSYLQTAVARYETAVRDAERAARVINDAAAATPYGLQTAAALQELLEVCDRFNTIYRAALESLGPQQQQRGPLLSSRGEVLASSVDRQELDQQLALVRRAAVAQQDPVALDVLDHARTLLHNNEMDAAVEQLAAAQERLAAGLEAETALALARSRDAPVEQITHSPTSVRTRRESDDTPR